MTRLIPVLVLCLCVAVLVGPATVLAGSGDHAYVGSKKCKMCHIKEYKSWEATKMANAFDVLKAGANAEAKKTAGLDPDKDYTGDKTCLRCHTTGYGKEGGFVDIASTPELAGVGCEMCHGPGGSYTKSGFMTLQNKEYKKEQLVAVGLVGTITVDQCQGCHNTDSPFVGDDYVFDFEANKAKGTHEKIALKYQH